MEVGVGDEGAELEDVAGAGVGFFDSGVLGVLDTVDAVRRSVVRGGGGKDIPRLGRAAAALVSRPRGRGTGAVRRSRSGCPGRAGTRPR